MLIGLLYLKNKLNFLFCQVQSKKNSEKKTFFCISSQDLGWTKFESTHKLVMNLNADFQKSINMNFLKTSNLNLNV